jgi:hypothetical protein
MTIWTWLLMGLIGLLVYINLGHLFSYLYAKACWTWDKNKKFNLAAKVLFPSPATLGIGHPILVSIFLSNHAADTHNNFVCYYDATYSPGLKWTSAAIWPIILGVFWFVSAADWVRWLLKVVFYKRLVKGFIYGVLISGHWTEKL